MPRISPSRGQKVLTRTALVWLLMLAWRYHRSGLFKRGGTVGLTLQLIITCEGRYS